MGSGSLDAWRREFFSAFDSPGAKASLEPAQHLVHGAVAFARGLGFEPHEEFAQAVEYLGEPTTTCCPWDSGPLVLGCVRVAAGR
ncbi:hypothetical protein WKI65_33945 [Streptomyces sp. MS1.AVA.3]|uniref:hypothetical protein n=1 Tax=Streptomyces decoyicus TaxID=249567 RepID=UPI0030C0E5E8